jgi:hypothetical protein
MTTELARAAKPWLTAAETAQYIGFSRLVVERGMNLGAIPFIQRGTTRLIAAEDARLFRTRLVELARDAGVANGVR